VWGAVEIAPNVPIIPEGNGGRQKKLHDAWTKRKKGRRIKKKKEERAKKTQKLWMVQRGTKQLATTRIQGKSASTYGNNWEKGPVAKRQGRPSNRKRKGNGMKQGSVAG